MRFSIRPAAAGRLCAFGLAACGSAALSPSQQRTDARQICTLADHRLAKIAVPTAPDGEQRYLSAGIAVLAPELADLRALGLAPVYRRPLSASAGELSELRSTLDGLRAGDDPVVAINRLQDELAPLEARAAGEWRSVGAAACATS
jgi:hypothetical protein